MAETVTQKLERRKNIYTLTLALGAGSSRGMARLLTILPTLNAAHSLGDVFESLAEGESARLNAGWLVADGGSSDATLEVARRAGAHVVTGPRGRGAQLAAGAEAAARLSAPEDWYLFLHADTRLHPGWTGPVRHFMAKNADRQRAGYFKFALGDDSPKARRLERAVAWRCKVFALPYGDQGLLVSRRFYEALGGYKPWPLFEDVDMVRRIGRGRLEPLKLPAVTSAQRFLADGYTKRSLKNLTLLARYYLGAAPQVLARAYRK
jgi:rSAM/selenodomain-associated transferase 2